MSNIKRTVLLSWILFPIAATGQSNSWERMQQIEPGRNVEVARNAGKPVYGKFHSSDGAEVKVSQDGGKIVAIPKTEVKSLALVIGKSRSTKFAIGFVAGAAGFGSLMGASCASGCEAEALVVGVIGTPVVGMIAGGIAALFPPHREIVYMSNERLDQTAARAGMSDNANVAAEGSSRNSRKPAKGFWAFRRSAKQ